MTQPTVAGQALTEEQRAFLLAQQAQQAAESPSPAGDQAAVATQLAAAKRGPLLPAEEQIDALMAQLRAQSEQLAKMGAGLASVQRQMEEAQAASGGPLTVRYAQGAADKLKALADQWPNHPLGAEHFAPAHEAAATLADAAKAVAKGSGPLHEVEHAASAVQRFITRVHPRQGGAHIDWSAILDDVELAVEEAAKLAAVI